MPISGHNYSEDWAFAESMRERKMSEQTKINRHEDHEADCLCCIHLSIEEATPTWSSWTGGDPAAVRCQKGVFPTLMGEDTADKSQLHECYQKARTCPHFEGRPR